MICTMNVNSRSLLLVCDKFYTIEDGIRISL